MKSNINSNPNLTDWLALGLNVSQDKLGAHLEEMGKGNQLLDAFCLEIMFLYPDFPKVHLYMEMNEQNPTILYWNGEVFNYYNQAFLPDEDDGEAVYIVLHRNHYRAAYLGWKD